VRTPELHSTAEQKRKEDDMKRKLLIAALALGTLGGFASGFASLACRARYRHHYMEQKVTDICTKAIEKAQQREASKAQAE
jgi:hypothetical protein